MTLGQVSGTVDTVAGAGLIIRRSRLPNVVRSKRTVTDRREPADGPLGWRTGPVCGEPPRRQLRFTRRWTDELKLVIRSEISGDLVVAVTEESPSPGRLLADRLDYLFRTVHPKGRGPYTPAEVAEAINETAGERVISSTYVWQLRTGRRDNPTQKHLSALAAFFGVSPMYFFQQAEADRGVVPPELVAALRNDEVRDMALRTVGLSDRALRAIKDMIENARAVEGLATEDPRT